MAEPYFLWPWEDLFSWQQNQAGWWEDLRIRRVLGPHHQGSQHAVPGHLCQSLPGCDRPWSHSDDSGPVSPGAHQQKNRPTHAKGFDLGTNPPAQGTETLVGTKGQTLLPPPQTSWNLRDSIWNLEAAGPGCTGQLGHFPAAQAAWPIPVVTSAGVTSTSELSQVLSPWRILTD